MRVILATVTILLGTMSVAQATGYFASAQQCGKVPFTTYLNPTTVTPQTREEGLLGQTLPDNDTLVEAHCSMSYSKTPPNSGVTFGQLDVFYFDSETTRQFYCRPSVVNWDGIKTAGAYRYSCITDGGCPTPQSYDLAMTGSGTLRWVLPISASTYYPTSASVHCYYPQAAGSTVPHTLRGMRYNIN